MALTKIRRIAVHEDTYEKLRDLGKTSDSFNEVIVRILEQNNQKERIVKING